MPCCRAGSAEKGARRNYPAGEVGRAKPVRHGEPGRFGDDGQGENLLRYGVADAGDEGAAPLRALIDQCTGITVVSAERQNCRGRGEADRIHPSQLTEEPAQVADDHASALQVLLGSKNVQLDLRVQAVSDDIHLPGVYGIGQGVGQAIEFASLGAILKICPVILLQYHDGFSYRMAFHIGSCRANVNADKIFRTKNFDIFLCV